MPKLVSRINRLPSATATTNFINAESGIQAQTINSLNVTQQIILPENITPEYAAQLSSIFKGMPVALPEDHVSHYEEWNELSKTYYNLFVLENEEYECGAFSIPRDVSVCRYMHREDIELFRLLSDGTRNDIFNMPCIFAKRNLDFRSTDENHPALLGRITDIAVQRSNLKIRFSGYQPIRQQLLNENPEAFGLATSALRTELDEEHWSIKRINLVHAIEKLGIKVE
jgi:hypothetical protein